jgi:hypothetical protein
MSARDKQRLLLGECKVAGGWRNSELCCRLVSEGHSYNAACVRKDATGERPRQFDILARQGSVKWRPNYVHLDAAASGC